MIGFARRYALVVLPYLLIVAVFTGGLWAVNNAQQRACRRSSENREVIRRVVDVATGPAANVGGPVNLAHIAGFDQLDPYTQAYLVNLSAVISRANPSGQPSLHDRLLAQIPPVRC